MTVQTRIILFIVGSGFLASLIFSVVVFYEMAEQPFNLLDTVLQEEATRVVRTLVNAPKKVGERKGEVQPLGLDQYWLEVWDAEDGRLLFRSALASQIRLASLAPGSSAIMHPLIVEKRRMLPWQKGNSPVFRVKTLALDMEGQDFRVQIGRPMEKLNEEIWDLFFGLLAGLIFSTLVLSAISRYVARKILQPVQQIKELAKEISEHNLSQRIPLREPGDEVNELAKTINMMLDRLQYSFDRQRGFLYATSHELKTPLATIRLGVDEIFSRETASVSAPVWDTLLRISHQSFRLERLVNDLLTLSSLETLTGIECHPVDLSVLLHSLVEDFGVVAEESHIGINCAIKPDCRVQGSSKMLHRALANLLDNALKYNEEGGQVDLSCSQVDDSVIVTVANTGAGVTEEEMPQVFDLFYRGEKSRSSEFGGFGLGLAIVKKIIDLHKGNVSFTCGLSEPIKVLVRFQSLNRDAEILAR